MGLFFEMVLTIRTKERMIQQKYVIDGVNYGADMNKFTQTGRQCKN